MEDRSEDSNGRQYESHHRHEEQAGEGDHGKHDAEMNHGQTGFILDGHAHGRGVAPHHLHRPGPDVSSAAFRAAEIFRVSLEVVPTIGARNRCAGGVGRKMPGLLQHVDWKGGNNQRLGKVAELCRTSRV